MVNFVAADMNCRPEDHIRFEAMLKELREEKEPVDQRLIDHSGDVSIQILNCL